MPVCQVFPWEHKQQLMSGKVTKHIYNSHKAYTLSTATIITGSGHGQWYFIVHMNCTEENVLHGSVKPEKRGKALNTLLADHSNRQV